MEVKRVKIAGQEFEVQRFRGLKAILAVAAVTRIGREVPGILADAVKDFQTTHRVTITEGMQGLSAFSGFSEEDFDMAEKRTGKREISLPAPMDQNEQLLQALPRLLEEARKEVIRLFAILITPNEELKAADKAGDVEGVLEKHYDLLLYEAELDQLADLALAAQDVVKDQLSDKSSRLGNLIRGLTGLLRGRSTQQTPDMTTLRRTLDTSESQTLTPPTSTNELSTSSTPSQAPTDGTEPQLSTTSGGMS